MKKKIYFIISSILQMIGAIIALVNVQALVQASIKSIQEVYAMFPVELQERMIANIQNNGANVYIFMSIVILILNGIMVIYAINNSILKKKGWVIAFSVICFFMSTNILVQTFSLVNFIVILCLRRKNSEDYPSKEKKKIPKIEYEKTVKKEKWLAGILLLVYFLGILIIPVPKNQILAVIRVAGTYVVLFVLSIIAFWEELIKSFKILKENFGTYASFLAPRLLIMYVGLVLCNLISIIISQKGVSENQSAIEAMPRIISIPLAIIWAPIVEELVFRGAVRKFIRNDKVFIVATALIFGLMHSIGEATLFNVIVMAIPYSFLGGYFAYLYTKSNNITTNIIAHGVNNTIASILTLMV